MKNNNWLDNNEQQIEQYLSSSDIILCDRAPSLGLLADMVAIQYS
ncbi:MAG: hypothetical protein ACOCWH_00045 [Spirochaetota bacterium]